MGGMSCNEMSLIPWHVLKKASDCCVTVNDSKVPKTIAMLKDKKLSKRTIVGGECATPGIISLISLCNNPKTKKLINLNEKSNVLVIGCEGNADEKSTNNCYLKAESKLYVKKSCCLDKR